MAPDPHPTRSLPDDALIEGKPSPTPTTITRASPDDLDALVPLFDAYRVFYDQRSRAAHVRAFLAERLQKQESVIFIARVAQSPQADAPAGFAQLYPSFTSIGLARSWILSDVFVHRDHRNRAIGRALVQRCIEHAEESGAARLTLETARDNSRAKRLYEALGFKPDTGFVTYQLAVD
jgi:ribosomal protein S18 acetylase RimI-like enzyme